jgi:hypothetical protein
MLGDTCPLIPEETLPPPGTCLRKSVMRVRALRVPTEIMVTVRRYGSVIHHKAVEIHHATQLLAVVRALIDAVDTSRHTRAAATNIIPEE